MKKVSSEVSREQADKVETLRKQLFDLRLQKSVSGSFNQSKAKLLKREIVKILASVN